MAGGFVQNQDGGPGGQGSGQGHALTLPAGESAAPFPHPTLVAHGQSDNFIVDGGQSGRLDNLRQGHVRLLQGDAGDVRLEPGA